VLPFPVELLRFLENNTNLATALSAANSAAEKTVGHSESGERPGTAERLSSPPEVPALEARETNESDGPPSHTANGLSPVTKSGS